MLSEHCAGNPLGYSPDSPGSFISSILKHIHTLSCVTDAHVSCFSSIAGQYHILLVSEQLKTYWIYLTFHNYTETSMCLL